MSFAELLALWRQADALAVQGARDADLQSHRLFLAGQWQAVSLSWFDQLHQELARVQLALPPL